VLPPALDAVLRDHADQAGDAVLVGLVGSGIGPSLTPALHEREARELGLPYRYHLIDLDTWQLPPEVIGDVLAAARSGYSGLNVTHPCKQAVLTHLDELSPDAAALGAVNTVVFTDGHAVGHNTDWSAFAHGLRTGLPGAALGTIVLLGAGGGGTAVGHALLKLGTGHVRVFDRELDRARVLADALRERFGHDRASAGERDLAASLAAADGLVHATPTGMAAHPGLPLDARLLRAGLWVADIVYRPLETALVTAARTAGCRVLDGGRMAVFQAAEAFRLFTGVGPDAERMLHHFDQLTATAGRTTADALD
jgi:quinate/shikimate dehydrogenase (NAD+)